mmetsp:Transcript_63337/g.165875  ORF Transcript_63337/g.165875 Transcript_63337/m.165875 type:complete len:213 (-) Transcript_63337:292-930(-)
MAPMPNSRMPKRMLRPSKLPGRKSPVHFIRVMFEGARSAEPPMSSGSVLAMAFRQSCEYRRVALPASSGVCVGRHFSQPSGSFLSTQQRWNCFASSGSFFWYSAHSLFHSSSFLAPSSACALKVAYTCGGTSNSPYFQPSWSRVSCVSAAPRGAPWASWLSALFGEPKPITVLTLISVGLSVHAFASLMAFLMASTSVLPSSTVITCQPYAS